MKGTTLIDGDRYVRMRIAVLLSVLCAVATATAAYKTLGSAEEDHEKRITAIETKTEVKASDMAALKTDIAVMKADIGWIKSTMEREDNRRGKLANQ